MTLEEKFRPLYAKDKIILLFFVPFFLWSFLGGHKQFVFGFNTDHLATALAFIGSSLFFITITKVPKKFLIVLNLLLLLFSFFLITILFSELNSYVARVFFINFVYLYITLALALYFRDRLDLFFSLIICFSLASSLIVLLSFFYLGFGSWLRVTIPVFEYGQFLYFPNGYESSSDPNVLSYFLFLGALVTFYIKGFRSYWWAAFSLIVFAGLLTMSRSGFLGFLIAISVYFGIGLSHVFSRQKISKGSFLMALSFIVFVPILVFGLFFLYDFSYVFDLVENRIYSTDSNESRIDRLVYSYNDFINNSFSDLFFGHGLGYTRIDLDPHFFWLSILLDTGLVSFLLTLFIFVFLFVKSYDNVRYSSLKYLLVSLFFFFLTISFLYWQLRTFYFVLLIFIVIDLSTNQLSTINKSR